MTQPQHAGPILDYASPRPRGRLRLPAHSMIRCERDTEGRGVTITETLHGRGGAIGAIVFACFTLAILGVCIEIEAARFLRKHDDPTLVILLAGVWIAEIVVMLLVIDQTWRKTILRASADALVLVSHAPLRKNKYEWPRDAVADIRVKRTQDVADGAPLAEVEIHFVDRPVVALFTDHLLSTIASIAGHIAFALGIQGDAPAPLPLQTGFPTAIDVPAPDERTFDRLLGVRRQIRSRER